MVSNRNTSRSTLVGSLLSDPASPPLLLPAARLSDSRASVAKTLFLALGLWARPSLPCPPPRVRALHRPSGPGQNRFCVYPICPLLSHVHRSLTMGHLGSWSLEGCLADGYAASTHPVDLCVEYQALVLLWSNCEHLISSSASPLHPISKPCPLSRLDFLSSNHILEPATCRSGTRTTDSTDDELSLTHLVASFQRLSPRDEDVPE